MAKKKDLNERVRKIGERAETIQVLLTDTEVEGERGKVLALLDKRDEAEEKLKGIKSEHKAKVDAIDEQITYSRRLVVGRKKEFSIIVEEHLTQGNEVVRIRQDTGEQIGARTATPRELQEDLFPAGDAGPTTDGSDDPRALDDAFGADGS